MRVTQLEEIVRLLRLKKYGAQGENLAAFYLSLFEADTRGIGGAPRDAAFGIDSLEIADEEDAQVDARGWAGPPHFLGAELLAGSFGEFAEAFDVEQFIEPRVEWMSGRGRHLLVGDPQCLLPILCLRVPGTIPNF